MFQVMVLAVVALLVGADQLTKWLAVLYLKSGETVNAVPGVLRWAYVENRGAAFGMFAGARWVFIAVTAVILLALLALVLFGRFRRYPLFNISATLVIAGGMGNLIDRIIQGYVVDFIETVFMEFPVFNVADCCVVVGSILLLVFFCFVYDDKAAKKSEVPHGADPTDGAPSERA